MENRNQSNVSLFVAMTVALAIGCDELSETGEQLDVSVVEELDREPSRQEGDDDMSAPEDDMEASSFAAERGISVDDARLRLARQVLAPRLAEAARRELGQAFGGAWIDVHDDDVIKIGVTSLGEGEAEVVERLARGVGLTGGYEAAEVRHSMAALESVNAFLADALVDVNLDEGASLTVGLRTDINVVELQVPVDGGLSSAQERLVASARERFGDALLVGSYRGRPEPRSCTYPNCSPPLRGGIRINGSNTGCTGGFTAKNPAGSEWYQFTAGHCIAAWNGNWTATFTDKTVHTIGGAAKWAFNSSGDVAILRINNPLGWNPKPWVNVTAGPNTTANSSYLISADSPSLVGMRICTTGASFGKSSCGFVTHLGVTVYYEDKGVTVKNLGRASTCAIPGDSGAPVFASHTAYGLMVGGYSLCDTLFQSIRAGELLMNANVIHG
ncbi:MAG: hypothetical protein IPO88_20995 [Nannocystis sp.]|uniref:S1 family peptidase n=1 Tax=Nannocystis sp. TaxID=1962667 RepID=UPI0024287097|nr:S1 family peptidase [Nannocystis sp.]MBK9755930.1 hypothetical protein [Nannocystis sp.]